MRVEKRASVPEDPPPPATGLHRETHPQRRSRYSRRVAASDARRAVVIALCLLAATWFAQRPLAQWTSASPSLSLYVIQPIVWMAFAGVSYRLYTGLPHAPRFSRVLTWIAFVAGVFQISIVTLSGFVFGFSDNPLAGNLANYPRNALYFTTLVLGVEVTRAYVFHALRPLNETAAFAAVTVFFAAIVTPVGEWVGIHDTDTLFQIGFGRFLPALTLSAVATAFAAVGGVLASAAYRWPLLTFIWLFPILPAYEWPMRSLLWTALPMAAFLLARVIYAGTAEYETRHAAAAVEEEPAAEERSRFSWVLVGLVAVLILLFVNGAFGVRPYLLSGISMEPGLGRGDVVIIREVPVESLEVSDIIRFRLTGIDYVHRIIDIYEEDGELVFVTKGDNVDLPDPPVPADAVTGKAVFLIPKAGWVSLWIRETLDGR